MPVTVKPVRRPKPSLWTRIGITWGASPARRVIQSACLLLFLVLLCYVAWPYGSPDYVQTLKHKAIVPPDTFLMLDPLVGVSTALAARTWNWALAWAGGLLLVSWLWPRSFCGYLCPLGTLIDLFDHLVGRRVKRYRVKERGGWVHLKYYLLAGILLASVCGVLVAGYFAAIPVVTRGLQFTLGPLELGLRKGWYLIAPSHLGVTLSIILFFSVLALGLLKPRFWCRFVCPTGAMFSLSNLLRWRERKLTDACISCHRCVTHCPFDAIRPDYTTRTADCTVCGTCAGVCPTNAIYYTWRLKLNPRDKLPAFEREIPLSRRGFLGGAAGGCVAALGIRYSSTPLLDGFSLPVRPPGSVPEPKFLDLCIRCGECYQACPNTVLQPLAFQQGLAGLWTPHVVAKWSGCEPHCNNCGMVCPTGAIRPLPLDEKRAARMGLAMVDQATCLPLAGREGCQLCVDECKAAGYNAIEFMRVGTQVDSNGQPIEGSGFLAPVVQADHCVGCGLCETRCHKINVASRGVLKVSAIQVRAGPGREDRLTTGSYRELRAAEQEKNKRRNNTTQPGGGDSYLPDFLK